MHLPHNERTVASHGHKTKEEPRKKKKRNEGGGGAQGRREPTLLKWRQKEREKTWGVKKRGENCTGEEEHEGEKKTNGRECESWRSIPTPQ